MKENIEVYWIYILPHTYCNMKNGCALMYNTLTAEYLETKDRTMISLLEELHEEKNLGAVRISGTLLQSDTFNRIFKDIVSKGLGNAISTCEQRERPIQMMPVLNLQQDIDKMKTMGDFGIGEYLYKYLWEIDIYLSGKCSQDCLYCSWYSKQVRCCRKGDEHEMSVDMLLGIAEQIKRTALMKINFYGGNIAAYRYIRDIDNIFRDFKGEIRVFNHLNNWTDLDLPQHFSNNIIVTFPLDHKSIKDVVEYSNNKNYQTVFHFIVSSETEYAEAESLIENLVIKRFDILPFYTGYNEDFFTKFVMQDKKDILSDNIIPFRRIFSHQKMNGNFFGKLTVLPDGTVYAVLGEKCIGNLHNDTLLKVIYNELSENTAWRCVRDKKPCSDCLLQYLCPSPSAYEKAMDRSNLCLAK